MTQRGSQLIAAVMVRPSVYHTPWEQTEMESQHRLESTASVTSQVLVSSAVKQK
jgi:hypothetical protein